MTFLSPIWLVAGIAAAAIVAGIHLLTRARPRPRPLPTARFVPEASLRTFARTAKPADVLLLLARVAAVVLIGIALARPVFNGTRKPIAVVALFDASPGADSIQVAGRLAMQSPPADTVIPMPGLSAGLMQARRAAGLLAPKADSVDLVVISSLTRGTWDDATEGIRRSWPGRIRIQPVAPVFVARPMAEVDAGAEDAVRAALTRLGRHSDRGTVLVRRLQASAADSIRVSREGGVLLYWPVAGETRDTADAVVAGGVAVVGPVPKRLSLSGPGIAHYADGAVAATERPLGAGCVRTVGFSLDMGDATLRSSGLHLVERMLAPCGAGWTPDLYGQLDSTRIATLAGSGPLAAPSDLVVPGPRPPAAVPLLLAAFALVAERVLRRRGSAP